MLHHRYGCNRRRTRHCEARSAAAIQTGLLRFARNDGVIMKLQGKTALVTGSTSGIGLAIARAFAFEGASLMINGFGEAQEIEEIRRELENSSGAQVLYDGAD